jgi:hypothetical protein
MKKADLILERRAQVDKTLVIGPAVITPPIDEDYWEYRVRLTDGQAVVGFPKFFTVGIGFAVEEDWNTNLPYLNCTAEEITNHIWHNRACTGVTRALVIEAVQMIREAAAQDNGTTAELKPKMSVRRELYS